jgi:hypothetical protein
MRAEPAIILRRPIAGEIRYVVLLLDSLTVVSRKGFRPLMITPDVISRLNSLSPSSSDSSSHLEFRGGEDSDHLFADEEQPPESIGDLIAIEQHKHDTRVEQVREPEPEYTDEHDSVDIDTQDHSDGLHEPTFEAEATPDEAPLPVAQATAQKLPRSPISKSRAASELKIDAKYLDPNAEYGVGKRTRKPSAKSRDNAMFLEQLLTDTVQMVEASGPDHCLSAIECAVDYAFAAKKNGNLSPKKATVKYGQIAHNAAVSEFKQIVMKDVFEAVHYNDLSPELRGKAIRSHTFFKEKWKTDGDLEKLKARLVAGGNLTDPEDFDTVTSPTARTETSMLLHAIAAYQELEITAMDIPGAYLNTKLPEEQRLPMLLGPEETAAVVELKPEWKPFVTRDKRMWVLLKGGLYGLRQAAKLWFEMLSGTLLRLGYAQAAMDPCLFIKFDANGKRSYIVVHVDDLAHFYDSEHFQAELQSALTADYGEPTFQRGDNGVYIGIEYQYNRADRSVRLTMKKYIDKLLAHFQVTKPSALPAAESFMEVDTGAPKVDAKKFASKVMSIYYLAARCRKDLLFHITVLAMRISDCNAADEKKVDKLLRYILATRTRGVVLRPRGTTLHFYVDAAYAIHANARSHSGMYVTLGGDDYDPSSIAGPIFARSVSQKLVTLSSFEAELNAVHQNVMFITLFRSILSDLGFDQAKPSLLMQDNQATILVINRGQEFRGRSKHIDVRYFYITELIQSGVIKVVYCPTNEMIADGLSKNIHSQVDQHLLQSICNDFS